MIKKKDTAAQSVHKAGVKKGKQKAKSELADLKEKCDEYLSGWKRAQADYQNLQKQVSSEREALFKYAAEGVVTDLLDVYSNFVLALSHVPEHEQGDIFVGFEHIRSQLWEVLESNGVSQVETVGTEFDPTIHEAVEDSEKQKINESISQNSGTRDSSDNELKQIVVKEIQQGFKLNGRLIRPAKVIVS